MRIAVTGGSGKLGRHVVARLSANGHDVLNLDREGTRGPGFLRVDLSDYGQVVDALAGVRDGAAPEGVEAIVHLAAIPAPGIASDVETFRNNITTTFNVFHAAIGVGIRNIVYASSETVLGLPFDTPPPYVPVDEEYPARPESVYSLVKHLEEQMGEQLCRWHPDLKIVGLRFSNVMDESDYAEFPFDDDARTRKWNLWAYIDGRDGAQAVEKALALEVTGFDRFVIASPDSVMTRANAELLDEVYPDVPRRDGIGDHTTLLSIDKARRVLGYEPEFSWRQAKSLTA
jgi:UDP-glucose 4-epimerase